MADIVNAGVKRTDEGIVYTLGQALATTANPSGSFKTNGTLPRTRAQVITKDNQIVVFYV
jgi:hypothetical protein